MFSQPLCKTTPKFCRSWSEKCYSTLTLRYDKQYLVQLKRKISTSSTCYNYTSVADFYVGKSVFITGATGFLGKVFVEKLLYSCNGIEKIYILTRAKNGLTLNQRVEQLTDSPVFNRLKASRPEDLSKILPVSGDLTAPGLGLSKDDEDTLVQKVSVVFHSAATINFNEPLRVALNINLEGTQKVLELCKRMRNIRTLVHVSTAYCNTDKEVIEERVYPPPVEIDNVYKYVEKYGDDKKMSKLLLSTNGRPNTYCFTKALTESYLAKNHGDVPIVILRPSMVTAAVNEPLVGWLDGWQGITTIMAMTARGLYRVILGNDQSFSDFIPVDYVVNMALVAAVYSKNNELTVYNCCTSGVNPITWERTQKLFLEASKADNFHKLAFPGVKFTHSRVVLKVLTLLTQTLPAYVLDACRWAMGKQPKYVRLNRQLISLRNQVQYFCSHNWVMESPNAQALAASLSSADARRFHCHPANVRWSSYMPIHYMGVKKFLFGDKA